MSTVPGKIQVACPQCGNRLQVPVSFAGKKGRCPSCQNVFPIKAPQAPLMAEVIESDLEPLPDLAPLPESAPFPNPGYAPLANDPFAAGNSSDYTLQSAQPQQYYQNQPATSQPQHALANQYLANAAASMQQNPYTPSSSSSRDTDDGWGINAGVGGGLLLMIGAVVWFVVALVCFDVIFFYPPIMFIIGLIAFFRGIANSFG